MTRWSKMTVQERVRLMSKATWRDIIKNGAIVRREPAMVRRGDGFIPCPYAVQVLIARALDRDVNAMGEALMHKAIAEFGAENMAALATKCAPGVAKGAARSWRKTAGVVPQSSRVIRV